MKKSHLTLFLIVGAILVSVLAVYLNNRSTHVSNTELHLNLPSLYQFPEGIEYSELTNQPWGGRITKLFTFYIDSDGLPRCYDNLGLRVTDSGGTGKGVIVTNFQLTISGQSALSGKANTFKPSVNLHGNITNTNSYELIITGKILTLTPKYTLIVDPTWDKYPSNYLTRMIWAEDGIVTYSAQAAGDTGAAVANNGKQKIAGEFTDNSRVSFSDHFQNALFGQFEKSLNIHPRDEEQWLSISQTTSSNMVIHVHHGENGAL
jgi:hypothetical protein